MNFFTLAYLGHLALWGLAAAYLQGMLVMGCWLAWDRALARARAISRYRVACIHFAALAMVPAATLAVLHATAAGIGVIPGHGSPVAEFPALMAGYRMTLQLAVALVLVWLAGAGAMAWRLVSDARQLTRLRREPAPAAWVEAVRRMARERMKTPAPDVYAADVDTPQVWGLRRPVLLVPRDLPVGLSAPEREAVLLHELAHLQRHDVGWNLLQRLALALLWCHPAAWLLYRRLSREREARCDALAVHHGASPTGLARALVRLAEHRAQPRLGMAASSCADLAVRVHRLLDSAPCPSPMRLRAAAVGASVCCLLAVGAGRLGRVDPALADLFNASAFGSILRIDAHDDAGSFALQIRRGRVIGASMAGRPVPADRIRQNGSLVTLLDPARLPALALTVTPLDKVEWAGRRPRAGLTEVRR